MLGSQEGMEKVGNQHANMLVTIWAFFFAAPEHNWVLYLD